MSYQSNLEIEGYSPIEIIVKECPCGKGNYTEYIDRTPGFKEHDAYFQCKECDKKYNLVKQSNGRFIPELKDEKD